MEHGHSVPSLKTLERLAAVLNVPMYWLFYNAVDATLTAAEGGRGTPTTLEDLAKSTGNEGSEAGFLLQLKGLIGNMMESDRAFLMALARKLAYRR
jgi:hypothetical protein